MKTLLFILSAFVIFFTATTDSMSDEYGVYTYSIHYDVNDDEKNKINEINPGFYYVDSNITIGTFINSYNDRAVFFGKSWVNHINNKISLIIDSGLLHGYGWDNGRLGPSDIYGDDWIIYAVPRLRFNLVGGHCLNVHVTPATLALSYSFRT